MQFHFVFILSKKFEFYREFPTTFSPEILKRKGCKDVGWKVRKHIKSFGRSEEYLIKNQSWRIIRGSWLEDLDDLGCVVVLEKRDVLFMVGPKMDKEARMKLTQREGMDQCEGVCKDESDVDLETSEERGAVESRFIKPDDLDGVKVLDFMEITASFMLLQDLMDRYFTLLAQKVSQGNQDMNALTSYLTMYISQVMPFGEPLDTNLSNIHSILTKQFHPKEATKFGNRKRPTWKPHSFTGKQKVLFTIRENVDASLYQGKVLPDGIEIQDEYCANGSISCLAELEKFPDVKLNLMACELLRDIVSHDCCSQAPETLDQQSSASFLFNPPLSQFSLCQYKILFPEKQRKSLLPFSPSYEMRKLGPNTMQLHVLIQLSPDCKAEVDYFNVYMPFPKPVVHQKFNATSGQVNITQDQRMIIWRNNRFPKSRELSLQGIIKLSPTIPPESKTDPFFSDETSVIRLSFRFINQLLSQIEVKDVNISPQCPKAKIQIQQEMVSQNILLWNKTGEVRYARNATLSENCTRPTITIPPLEPIL